MTGKDIQNAAFEKAGMRGYRADQVDAYLHTVAEYVDEQNEKIEDLTYKLKVLADKVEEYRTDEENIREALKNGSLKREDLQACVKRMLKVIFQTLGYEDCVSYGAQFR